MDVREEGEWEIRHLKGSLFMGGGLKEFEAYCRLLNAYHETYPDNFIILIGDKNTPCHHFAHDLIK